MAQTVEQWLPLHFAARRGKLDVVEAFIDMGVSLEAMTVKLKTALHLAA
jgi:ankyrin repeat protein